MSLTIAGLGTALPAHAVSQEDAARHAAGWCADTEDEERRLHLLYRRSGVRSRCSVVLDSSSGDAPARQSFFPDRAAAARGPSTTERLRRYETDASPLAVNASRVALTDAGLRPRDVTHLVTVSCTGFSAPGVDAGIIEALELRPTTQRTHVGFMGCHGALNGLRVANAFLAADPSACVLLCAVELCSLHHQYGWRTDQVLANALFADGAAALIGVNSDTSAPGTNERTDAWRLAASGSVIVPDTADLMSWKIRDHGFEMTLSPDVPAVIGTSLKPWLTAWLERSGLAIGDIGSWAVHPGGPKILQATAAAAGFDPRQLAPSESVLAELGNMSSPTILFILDRLRKQNAPKPCVALAFGPGLAIEAALFV